MRKPLFLSLLVLCVNFASAQNGYLPNSSFENWTTTVIYENPDQWGTSNYRDYASEVNAFQSTDAQHLNSSLELQTIYVGTDTAFAYAFLGNVGEFGPDQGIPYVSQVDQLNGYYKGSIMSNDTAMVMVIKFLGGNMMSTDYYPIYTSQSSWTPFTMNLTAGPQDSIFVGFISANPFIYPIYAKPGTTVLFDNISLSHSTLGAGAALPNNSFETWVDISVTTPDSWGTLNSLFASSGLAPVTETSDANTGTSAAQIESLSFMNDTIPGFLLFGEFDLNSGNMIPFPYDAQPTTLSGFYKYTPSGADNAIVAFEFYNNGTVIAANQQNFTPASTYTAFNLATGLASAPDSLTIVFYSGDNPGSVLLVDDVQFSGGNVSINESSEDFTFKSYPNPANDVLYIEADRLSGEFTITVFDLTGKLLFTESGYEFTGASVNVAGLPNGAYNLQIESQNKRIIRPFSVMH